MSDIDLHVHTTVSDGTLTPSEVVRYAKKKGLKAIAITDHDTTSGNKEALEEGNRVGLKVLPGVEISVECVYGTMHLLAYCIDVDNCSLQERLKILQKARSERNTKILNKLKELGMEIDQEYLLQIAGGEQVGRPHIARALVHAGHISSQQEAFERFLKKGGPAYVDKFRFQPQEAIELVLGAKGVPVVAHPYTLGDIDSRELEGFVSQLVEYGLKGMEVFYPNHKDQHVAQYRQLAEKYGLLMTGGSDFHGGNKDDVDIGVFNGHTELSLSLIETLMRLGKAR